MDPSHEDRVRTLDEAHHTRPRASRSFLQQWWDSLLRGTRPAPTPPATGAGADAPALTLTFVGHSTTLLEYPGARILTDPHLGRWLMGLRRVRAAGIDLERARDGRLVLISHAHFDHLHRPTLRRLSRAATVVVPPRCADLVADLGFAKVVELGWGESHHAHGVEIVAVPARHWGRRTPLGQRRGYGGYVVRADDERGRRAPCVYFAGDTGYFSGFREIGRRFAPDVALLPIGAYDPPSFRRHHMSPLDALEAFADLGARLFVPVHFGSFTLSCEPIEEPAEWLENLARQRGLAERTRILDNGATLVVDRAATNNALETRTARS